jgi:hypothetical protein
MGEPTSKSWQDIVDTLQGAANELRASAGRPGATSAKEAAAATKLKSDVSRLEQSATDLRSRLAQSLDAQRSEFESTLDRERAEQTASQFKSAVDELLGLARSVSIDMKAAAVSTFEQSKPELNSAIRALEDVASSAADWMRAVVEPVRRPPGRTNRGAKPPLDNF